MKTLAAGTIVAGNYLAYARVLADSFRRYHPGVPFHVLVLDEPPPPLEQFRVVTPAGLELPQLKQILYAFGPKGASAALKPALLLHLFKQGYETALFLDADMLLLGDLQEAMAEARSHSLALTPHLNPAPESPGRQARERQILLAGAWNAGFVGASRSGETLRFLQWWLSRLTARCVDDLPAGLHYDQRWLDLAPGLVEDLCVLRDAGLNTAYWNLPDLHSQWLGEQLMVNGRVCRLFHFSGFDPARPDRVSFYAPDLSAKSLGVERLFDRYAALLSQAGHASCRARPWPWGCYCNGEAVTGEERAVYAALDLGARDGFGDPFATGPGSFHQWVRRPRRRIVRATRNHLRRVLRAGLSLAGWRPHRGFAP